MENMLELFKLKEALEVKKIKNDILSCNEHTEKYGLSLSDEDAKWLIHCREESLSNTGRIEFSETVLPKLIHAFCDSPYLNKRNYADVMAELLEAFYYYKNEYNDRCTDDELIELMVRVFNARGGEIV